MIIGNPVLRCEQDIKKALKTLESELAGLEETGRQKGENIRNLQERVSDYSMAVSNILICINTIHENLRQMGKYAEKYDISHPKPKEQESKNINWSQPSEKTVSRAAAAH